MSSRHSACPSSLKGASAGFSLVELSVVLVILGLLAGGVLSGQSLIRASELRSVSTDISRYNAAILTFRDKYFALPGDMPNAVRFWGAQAGSDTVDGYVAACGDLTAAATSKATCNGDGNGNIGESINNNISNRNYEMFRAWQHLANAGLIEGSYTGVSGTLNVRDSNVGENTPKTRLSQVGFSYGTLLSSTDLLADIRNSQLFIIGKEDNNAVVPAGGAGPTWSPFAKPDEVYSIDVKLDDGKPGTGALRPSDPTCATTTVIATAEYKLMESAQVCGIIYIFR